jgi:hypothetical protein
LSEGWFFQHMKASNPNRFIIIISLFLLIFLSIIFTCQDAIVEIITPHNELFKPISLVNISKIDTAGNAECNFIENYRGKYEVQLVLEVRDSPKDKRDKEIIDSINFIKSFSAPDSHPRSLKTTIPSQNIPHFKISLFYRDKLLCNSNSDRLFQNSLDGLGGTLMFFHVPGQVPLNCPIKCKFYYDNLSDKLMSKVAKIEVSVERCSFIGD